MVPASDGYVSGVATVALRELASLVHLTPQSLTGWMHRCDGLPLLSYCFHIAKYERSRCCVRSFVSNSGARVRARPGDREPVTAPGGR